MAKNLWLYNAIKKAENVNTDNPNFKFNVGGVIHAPWMDEYGVLKNEADPIRADDGNLYARPIFTSEDQANQVITKIQNDHWLNAQDKEDPFLATALSYTHGYDSTFTDLDQDSQRRVSNYADILADHYNHDNKKLELESAIKGVDNSNELDMVKPELYEAYPESKSLIDNHVNNGDVDLYGLLEVLRDEKEKQIKNPKEEGALKTIVDNIQLGGWNMVKDLGGGLEWFGAESIGRAMQESGKNGALYNLYQSNPDFEFSDILDIGDKGREFWTVHAPQSVPFMLSLFLPTAGGVKVARTGLKASKWYKGLQAVEKAYTGTKTGQKALKTMSIADKVASVTGGAMAGRGGEAFVEGGNHYLQMKDLGFSDQEAGESAQKVLWLNMTLSGADALQLLPFVGSLPSPLVKNFSKWFAGAGFVAGAVSEGYEEIVQDYFKELGRASIDPTFTDPELILAVKDMDPEQRRAFALGTVSGGLFQTVGAVGDKMIGGMSDQQILDIIEERYVTHQSRQEAMDTAVERMEGRIGDFIKKVKDLPSLKNRFNVLFSDKQMESDFTESELQAMGYEPEFLVNQGSAIQISEDSPRYNSEKGGQQFTVVESGINKIDDNGKAIVVLGNEADNHTIVEEISEIIYKEIEISDPDLYADIKAWEKENIDKSPYTARELFAKSFAFQYMDIQESGKSAREKKELDESGVEMPRELAERFRANFVNESGENVLDMIQAPPDAPPLDPSVEFMEQTTKDLEMVEQDETDILQSIIEDNPTALTEYRDKLVERASESEMSILNRYRDDTPANKLMNYGEGVYEKNQQRLKDFDEDRTKYLREQLEFYDLYLEEEGSLGDYYREKIEKYEKLLTLVADGESYVFEPSQDKVNKIKISPELSKKINQEKDNVKKIKELADKNRATKKEPLYNKNMTLEAKSRNYTKEELDFKGELLVEELNESSEGREILKKYGSPMGFKRKNKVEIVKHILKLKSELDSINQDKMKPFEGARFTIPSEMLIETSWNKNKKVLVKSVLDQLHTLKTKGNLRIYYPDEVTKIQKKNLIKLFTGFDNPVRDEKGRPTFKKKKDGSFDLTKKGKKKPNLIWGKSISGLFSASGIEEGSDSQGNYLEFNKRKQQAPPITSYISIDRASKMLGFATTKKDSAGKVKSRTLTQAEFKERYARAVETGVLELLDQSKTVFDSLIDLEYNKDNAPDFVKISLGWYTDAPTEAIKILQESELPSLKNNKEKQLLFRALLGFCSPDNAVDYNENLAIEVLKHIEQYGEPNFKQDKKSKYFMDSAGNKVGMTDAESGNIQAFFNLKKDLGSIQKAVDWITTKHEISDVKNKGDKIGKKLGNLGIKSYGYKEFDQDGIYGMELFGFKVGVFTGNLLGIDEIGTMDLWMTRQIARWLGSPFKQGDKNALKLVAERSFSVNDIKTDAYTQPKTRQNFHLMRQVVQGISEDQRIKDVFKDISPMQTQALLWYMEKALYRLQNTRGQKPLGEADYGNWAKERRNKREVNPSYTGFEPAKKTKAKPKKTESIRGGGKRPLRDVIATGTEGARFGRIRLNNPNINNTPSENFYNYKKTDEQEKRIKKHKELYSEKKFGDLLETFSSAISKIHPRFPTLFRQHYFGTTELINKYQTGFVPLEKALSDLDKRAKSGSDELKRDYVNLDLYLKNGDMKNAKPLINKYNLQEEISLARETYDSINEQARAVGFDFGYLNNYFPRVVNDHVNLLAYIKENTEPQVWKLVEEEIKTSDLENKVLTDEHKYEVAQKVLLTQAGYYSSKPDNLKVRKVLELDNMANTFYEPLHESMKIYLSRVSEAIATKKFLGSSQYSIRKKTAKSKLFWGELDDGSYVVYEGDLENRKAVTKPFKTKTEAEEYIEKNRKVVYHIHNKISGKRISDSTYTTKVQANKEVQKLKQADYDQSGIPSSGLDETIDNFILRAMIDYKIDERQADRLTYLMKAYFNRDTGNAFLMNTRKVGFALTLTNIYSTLTQLGDLGMSTWMAGDVGINRLPSGMKRTAKRFVEALVSGSKGGFSKNYITLQDMGIDVIEQDMKVNQTNMDFILEKLFTVVGFKAMDRIGKETTLNAIVDKYRSALIRGEGKTFEEIMFKLTSQWSSKESQQIINDLLQKDYKTDIVRQWAFCQMAGVQPIAMSEMPIHYLNNPSQRIMYQLKTFMIKRFDVYKDEIKFIDQKRQEALENKEYARARKLQLGAYMRIAMMMSVFVLAESGSEEIKDLLRGTEKGKWEQLLGNLLKQIGLSKYAFYGLRREGIDGFITNLIAPPVFNIFNDVVINDAVGIFSAKNKAKYIRKKKLKSYRHIPIIGKNLYHYNENLFKQLGLPKLWKLEKYGIGKGNDNDERYRKKK